MQTSQYRSNRVVPETSGQEVVEKDYESSARPDPQGFYIFVKTVLKINDKKERSRGLPEGRDDQSTRFLQSNLHATSCWCARVHHWVSVWVRCPRPTKQRF